MSQGEGSRLPPDPFSGTETRPCPGRVRGIAAPSPPLPPPHAQPREKVEAAPVDLLFRLQRHLVSPQSRHVLGSERVLESGMIGSRIPQPQVPFCHSRDPTDLFSGNMRQVPPGRLNCHIRTGWVKIWEASDVKGLGSRSAWGHGVFRELGSTAWRSWGWDIWGPG